MATVKVRCPGCESILTIKSLPEGGASLACPTCGRPLRVKPPTNASQSTISVQLIDDEEDEIDEVDEVREQVRQRPRRRAAPPPRPRQRREKKEDMGRVMALAAVGVVLLVLAAYVTLRNPNASLPTAPEYSEAAQAAAKPASPKELEMLGKAKVIHFMPDHRNWAFVFTCRPYQFMEHPKLVTLDRHIEQMNEAVNSPFLAPMLLVKDIERFTLVADGNYYFAAIEIRDPLPANEFAESYGFGREQEKYRGVPIYIEDAGSRFDREVGYTAILNNKFAARTDNIQFLKASIDKVIKDEQGYLPFSESEPFVLSLKNMEGTRKTLDHLPMTALVRGIEARYGIIPRWLQNLVGAEARVKLEGSMDIKCTLKFNDNRSAKEASTLASDVLGKLMDPWKEKEGSSEESPSNPLVRQSILPVGNEVAIVLMYDLDKLTTAIIDSMQRTATIPK